MTRKVFWEDPYLTHLVTKVTSVQQNRITLEETIFFAFSGGQESDTGTIGGFNVLEAQKEESHIFYTLPPHHTLGLHDTVQVNIDWIRRYSLMRLHFAAEIVLELLYDAHPSLSKVGAHISPTSARIDIIWPVSIAPILVDIEHKAQRIIDKNLPITCAYDDPVSQRRFWQIPGRCPVPCGGTHIRRTGEVGILHLKRSNPGKGRERIQIFISEERKRS